MNMAFGRRVDRGLIGVMLLWLYLSLISVTNCQDINIAGNGLNPNPLNGKVNILQDRFNNNMPPANNERAFENPDGDAAIPNNNFPNVPNRGGFNGVNPKFNMVGPAAQNVVDQNMGFRPPQAPVPNPQRSYEQPTFRNKTTIKLSEHPDCAKDVKMFCATSTNNFAILDCLQNDLQSNQDVSEACQHVVWGYKRNLTNDPRFEAAAKEVCKDEFDRFPECRNVDNGHKIPCLIEVRSNISVQGCRTFLKKMSSIIFSDYRLIYKFTDNCGKDIDKTDCGRLHIENDDSPHSQGRTVECLSGRIQELDEICKHEILRIAELQADDFHLDRPLFYACRDDRERLCQRTRAGSGKIYKCLIRHKFDREMSDGCREKLTNRQKLMQSDYKVNKGLAQACQQDIIKNKCIPGVDPGFKQARLSKVILCLENVMKNGTVVDSECVIELKEMRQNLMEDYQISPEIVSSCHQDIVQYCNGGVHREGKTLHCLMDLARPKVNKNEKVIKKGVLADQCLRELETLLLEADVGDDWTIDPTIREACDPIVQVACKDVKGGEGRVLNCLMEHIDSEEMTPLCEERLLEIHYFLARDFNLDARLYKFCHNDAVQMCSAKPDWHMEGDNEPNHGTLTFACLYRQLKFNRDKISRSCTFEMRRVMRQRALRVELEPRIEEPCMADLGAYCSEEFGKGEEMQCLQQNFNDLTPECKLAVGNFTEDEDSDPNMDKVLMKACSPMIKEFCEDLVKDDSEPGEVMACLIEHKTDNEMDEKCAAGIEHHQLITMKDYHFSVKFKEACKQDVMKICKSVRKKSEVVECLSENIRNAVLANRDHDVSKKCRRQLTVELLQMSENIKLDPVLQENCALDVTKFCSNVSPGKSNVIECLKKSQASLSQTCHELLFKREENEAIDATTDYLLMHACKKMIKRHCMDEKPSDMFNCLKNKKNEEDFDNKCRKVILERQRQRSKDIRLNPDLMLACDKDILKFCPDQMRETTRSQTEVEGTVIQCLKAAFGQRKALRDSCLDHVRGLIQEAALDYQQDPVLMAACKTEISSLCQESLAGDSADPDGGRVIECLKENLASQKISITNNLRCIKEIARVLAEDQADIHVDPLLYRECALDVKHYCVGIPRGEGRQMSCLLAALDDKKVNLQPRCEKMLRDRVNMWELAAKVAPPNTLQELVQQVTTSESRNYFLGVLFAVIGMIFIGGLMCGRVTKRVRAEMKNR